MQVCASAQRIGYKNLSEIEISKFVLAEAAATHAQSKATMGVQSAANVILNFETDARMAKGTAKNIMAAKSRVPLSVLVRLGEISGDPSLMESLKKYHKDLMAQGGDVAGEAGAEGPESA